MKQLIAILTLAIIRFTINSAPINPVINTKGEMETSA
jgi:hypothetical protein